MYKGVLKPKMDVNRNQNTCSDGSVDYNVNGSSKRDEFNISIDSYVSNDEKQAQISYNLPMDSLEAIESAEVIIVNDNVDVEFLVEEDLESVVEEETVLSPGPQGANSLLNADVAQVGSYLDSLMVALGGSSESALGPDTGAWGQFQEDLSREVERSQYHIRHIFESSSKLSWFFC